MTFIIIIPVATNRQNKVEISIFSKKFSCKAGSSDIVSVKSKESNLFNQSIMARVSLFSLINYEFRVYVFIKAGLSIVF